MIVAGGDQERLHVPQVLHGLVGAVAVGLVDAEDVGDLQEDPAAIGKPFTGRTALLSTLRR